jgi:hypothetical protein
MGDLVEETVRGIRGRLKDLAPTVAEYERLEAAYAALGAASTDSGDGRPAGAVGLGRTGIRQGARRAASPRTGPRAKRGQNKAAVFGVIAERPGVTVTEIAQVTGIAKPLIYNTTRAGVERGELERVALLAGQHGFKMAHGAPANDAAASST